jgi:hypothetical protein
MLRAPDPVGGRRDIGGSRRAHRVSASAASTIDL